MRDTNEDNGGDPSNAAPYKSLIENAEAGNAPVPPPPARPKRPVERGALGLRIARDGTWHYHDSPIGRLALVKLFASVLRREPDGAYWLVTPAERGRIEVEDAPFLAVELSVAAESGQQQLIFRTNLDDIVTAGRDHPLRVATTGNAEPAPYILVRDGLEARLSRPVFYELVEYGVEEQVAGARQFGVWSDGMFFRLGEPGEDWP